MKLTLTKDDGTVIDSWYLPDEETTASKVRSHIEGELPVYMDRKEYEELLADGDE